MYVFLTKKMACLPCMAIAASPAAIPVLSGLLITITDESRTVLILLLGVLAVGIAFKLPSTVPTVMLNWQTAAVLTTFFSIAFVKWVYLKKKSDTTNNLKIK